jgi:hypothetical protein
VTKTFEQQSQQWPNVDFPVAISHIFLSLLPYTPVRLFWLVSLSGWRPAD